jgi:uroporphyrinogen-III synthase
VRGKRIAVLESRLGRQLVELIEGRGAVVFHAPALAEIPDLDPAQIAGLVASLKDKPPAVAIFQTGVGTRALFSATDALRLTAGFLTILEKTTVAVRGPKPSAALRARGVRIDRSAADPFTTAEILQSLRDVPMKGARVLVQRHGTVNAELDRHLESAGAEVIEIPTYRWSLPEDRRPLLELVARLQRGELDAVVFTNAEQARNLFAVARERGHEVEVREALNRIVVASIGPVASAALREAGLEVRVEAKPPKLGALLAVLEKAFS